MENSEKCKEENKQKNPAMITFWFYSPLPSSPLDYQNSFLIGSPALISMQTQWPEESCQNVNQIMSFLNSKSP